MEPITVLVVVHANSIPVEHIGYANRKAEIEWCNSKLGDLHKSSDNLKIVTETLGYSDVTYKIAGMTREHVMIRAKLIVHRLNSYLETTKEQLEADDFATPTGKPAYIEVYGR